MKPVKFLGANMLLGANQPEYLALPAHRDGDGVITTCWKLSPWGRLKVLFTGRVWLQQMTFGGRVQPQKASAGKPVL